MNGHRAFLWLWLVAACAVASACSGGGSSPAPVPAASLAGQGSTEPLDQRITLQIEVPAEPAGLIPSAAAARARLHAVHRSAVAAAPPYLSPKTGSIELALAAIGGESFAQVPPAIPPIEVPAGCQGSATGCVLKATNIIAAKGVNTYLVTTYTGSNATGNVISSGFINVTAPATSAANLGGAAGALSIGGYVGSLALAPAQLDFTQGVVQSKGVLVQAFDPAGAAIVGADQFANPVVVSVADSVNFRLAGGSQVSLAQPITTPLPLKYLGGISLAGGTQVTASTTDENNAPASAAPLIVAIAAATSAPTSGPNPYSLYVDLSDIDTIQEYAIGAAVEKGNAPAPAPNGTLPPRRSLTFVPPKLSPENAQLVCSASGALTNPTGNGIQGVAIGANGTIVVAPSCGDGTNNVIYGYPATAVGSPPPQIGLTALTSLASSPYSALATDNARQLVFAVEGGYSPAELLGWPVSRETLAPQIIVGGTCIVEVAQSNCNGLQTFNPPYGYFNDTFAGVGIDGDANIYVPTYYNDPPLACAVLGDCAAVAVVAGNNSTPVANAYSSLAGPLTELGASNVTPLAATVDGTMLYVLALGTGTNPDGSYPGLSSCGATLDSPTIACQDGNQHNYLLGYQITPLIGPGANGTNVNLKPVFVLGGDAANRFGTTASYNSSIFGQYLAARDGYVYVLNPEPESPLSSPVVYAPEIDVYNTNGLTGPTIAKALVYTIPYASTSNVPLAIALGPVGPPGAVGGAFPYRVKPKAFRPDLYWRTHRHRLGRVRRGR